MSIYDFSVKNAKGEDIPLSNYKGKVLLIVNTATGCGFTTQYDELQSLYKEFNQKGFEILDFPCNQFANQAPGSDEEIHSFCTGRFGITFPQFAKIDVNGENAIPLYKWLTENTTVVKKSDKNYKHNGNIKWNFTKFLIDKEGNIVERFEPTDMKNLKEKISDLL